VQKMVNVVPDLSCFSKAMGNGLPIAALVGKKEIMSKFGDVYFSITAAGETLSLAAAKAVLLFFDQHDVIGQIDQSGKKLREGLIVLLAKYGLSSRIEVKGSNARFGIYFIEDGVRDQSQDRLYWTQCVCEEGLLNSGAHIMCYAHTDDIIIETLNRYDKALLKMKDGFNV
jgi:glutamate-1-semialdehyde 2,1-aminomutase